MKPSQSLTKWISNLLILSVLLQFLILCDSIHTPDSQESLSLVGSSPSHTNQGPKDPIEYNEDSLITPSGNPNKVSKLLRLVHRKTQDAIYSGKYGKDRAQINEVEKSQVQSTRDSHLTDDEVITSACNGRRTKPCLYSVGLALKADPRERNIIASALRHKPAHVDARIILYHALFGYSIAKIEQKHLDEKLDLVISLAAKRHPYTWALDKVLDYAIKTR